MDNSLDPKTSQEWYEEVEAREKEITALQADRTRLQAELADTKRTLGNKSAEHEKASETLTELAKKHEDLDLDCGKLREELSLRDAKIAGLNGQLTVLSDDLDLRNRAFYSAKAERAQFEEKYETLKIELATKEAYTANLSAEIEQMEQARRDLDSVQSTVQDLMLEIANRDEEMSDLRDRVQYCTHNHGGVPSDADIPEAVGPQVDEPSAVITSKQETLGAELANSGLEGESDSDDELQDVPSPTIFHNLYKDADTQTEPPLVAAVPQLLKDADTQTDPPVVAAVPQFTKSGITGTGIQPVERPPRRAPRFAKGSIIGSGTESVDTPASLFPQFAESPIKETHIANPKRRGRAGPQFTKSDITSTDIAPVRRQPRVLPYFPRAATPEEDIVPVEPVPAPLSATPEAIHISRQYNVKLTVWAVVFGIFGLLFGLWLAGWGALARYRGLQERNMWMAANEQAVIRYWSIQSQSMMAAGARSVIDLWVSSGLGIVGEDLAEMSGLLF
ncbi:hypothetical protein NA57DRAFT_70358 [Rhizodiscina lignyota]|uniref:Uncharacterized protein n=1 Tax=Rhizodiscina lignyota TaxID=1504668 RepID=A0A9P4IRP0_9PEZI|nr:hypothetical protein NA57DRAFT_70358 [Rhizodiscina lignyota]